MGRKKKASESALRRLMKNVGHFVHKWRDRGYVSCPKCYRQIKYCPHCHQEMLMPKAQTYPDFLVASRFAYVECKQHGEYFNLYDLSPRQEHVLTNAPQSGWVFLELGDRMPGRQAYLIEWREFVRIRQEIKKKGLKSVRRWKTKRSRAPLAEEVFEYWKLDWVANVGWVIPEYHLWWEEVGEPPKEVNNE